MTMTRDAGDPALIVRETILFALRSPAAVLDLSPGDLDLTLRLMRRARLIGWLGRELRDEGLLDGQPPVVADQLLERRRIQGGAASECVAGRQMLARILGCPGGGFGRL